MHWYPSAERKTFITTKVRVGICNKPRQSISKQVTINQSQKYSNHSYKRIEGRLIVLLKKNNPLNNTECKKTEFAFVAFVAFVALISGNGGWRDGFLGKMGCGKGQFPGDNFVS